MFKRILVCCMVPILVSTVYSQRNVPFSTEEYFGGGIGYTPMFLMLNVAERYPFNIIDAAATTTGLLETNTGLGFSESELAELGDWMIIHGAEGFGNVSGNWRVGAYVGLGSKSITTVDTASSLQTDLQVSLMTGNASVEFVIPIFSNLEIAAGSLFGLSRAMIQFARKVNVPSWEGQFTFTDIDQDNYSVALSGTFFSFQPYVAVKLQFMDRAGLRMSAGYNMGTLEANRWKLNDFGEVQAPSASDFSALSVRVMLYLGI
ncbi:hypothetical protein ACFL5M_05930 [Candidatus Neomarinimicrobiota bacterium]